MAQYQQGRHDPTRQTDEYGNPVHQGGATGMHGTGMGGATGMGVASGEAGVYGLGGGGQGQQQWKDQREGQGGVLQRSGSGSSSSSEDDGQGGRRKKGIKDKLMEKIPGVGGKSSDQQQTATGGYGGQHQAGGYGEQYQAGEQHQAGQQQEKKGMMDKIKEKLPGTH